MDADQGSREGCGVVVLMPKPISEPARILGARIRARRNALGISQEALAHRSGTHWTFVGQIERGQRNISLHNLLKLAVGLEVDVGELVRGLRPPRFVGAAVRHLDDNATDSDES